jgi:hypothetical protein
MTFEGPIRRPERGGVNGSRKKFFSKEIATPTRRTWSDTQNQTLYTQPSVCQNHIATKVLLVLGTNTTSSLNSYKHIAAKTTWELVVWRGRSDRYGGRLDRLHLVTEKSSETLLSTKHLTVSLAESLDQGQASHQVILVTTKTSPRGLRAVRLATWCGLTSYTQQETLSKNS